MYIKFVIVCDDDVNVCDWNDVIWVIIMCMDFVCDIMLIENILIDYLDFVLLVFGFGLKMGMDVINKWFGEIDCEWGEFIVMDLKIKECVDELWDSLDIF